MDKLNKNTSRSKTKSINTLESDLFPLSPNPSNPIHHYYSVLLSNLTNEYPELSKLIFLTLLLNSSSTIFTKHADQIKDIYQQVTSKLTINKNIYYCDNDTSAIDMFQNKDKQQIYLIFNILSLDNKLSNEIRQYTSQNIIINIQNTAIAESSRKQNHLLKQFGMLILDDSDSNFKQFIKKIDEKKNNNNKFNAREFKQCLIKIRGLAREMANSRFIKVYLIAYEILLSKSKLEFPHSRWKRTYQFIKLIALNKTQTEYKSLCLVDCIFTPWFLSTCLQQYLQLSKINQKVIQSLVVYYGVPKFMKHLLNHFFIPNKTKNHYYNKLINLMNKHSFFFPCSKYPDLVSIQVQEQECDENKVQFYYKVLGERKLMSDKHIEIDPMKQYTLSLDIRANIQIEVEIGIVCYDQNKQVINTKGSHEKQGTLVTIKEIKQNQIIVDQNSINNLLNWNRYEQQSHLQKKLGSNFCIGIYPNQQSTSAEYILKSKSLTESTLQNCGYSRIINDKIVLSEHLLVPFKHMIDKGIITNSSRLVNYINYPNYKLNKITPSEKWSKVEMKYAKENGIYNFQEEGVKYVRVMIIVEQHLVDKSEKVLYFKKVQFNSI